MRGRLFSGSALCALALSLLLLAVGCGASAPGAPGKAGARDNTPVVLENRVGTAFALDEEEATVDAAYAADGYVSVRGRAAGARMKVQITGPDGVTYTYDLTQPGAFETFSLAAGSGTYAVKVYRNVRDTAYALVGAVNVEAALTDEFAPFLRPNQYVNFAADSAAVEKARQLAAPCDTDLDVVRAVYDFVVGNIAYDQARVSALESTYLPDIDDVLEKRKGICFDYAALMTAMLRSQRIPTKLVIGYAGTVYHAWISTYIPEMGWVDGIIRFDGSSWTRMDPTFAAGSRDQAVRDFIGDGKNYNEMYVH